MILTEADIYAIERPSPRLLWLYMIHAIMTLPGVFITAPVLLFRYETMRYRFDDEGIHMRWGFFFRRQVNLTYARIQDIHLTSGLIQRWLGLADVQIQTASGSAGAEMTLEGLPEAEAIRDYLYSRMRGYRDQQAAAAPPQSCADEQASPGQAAMAAAGAEELALLAEAVAELKAARAALDRVAGERASQAGQAFHNDALTNPPLDVAQKAIDRAMPDLPAEPED